MTDQRETGGGCNGGVAHTGTHAAIAIRRGLGFWGLGLRIWRVGSDPGAWPRIPGKEEFEEISEILRFGVGIADSISRNSVIFVKLRGRYGYGGRPGRGSDSEVWAQDLTRGLRS